MGYRISEFRSGGGVLFAAAIGIACGSTVIPFNSFGAIITPLETAYGWGRGNIQIAYFLFTLASALTYPFVGNAIDRFGARRIALYGVPVFGLSFACLAATGGAIYAFYAGWILVGVLGAGATPVTFTRAINSWFVESRGLALAVALLLGGITSSGFQILSTALTDRFGWQSVFLGMALFPFLVSLPVIYWKFYERSEEKQEEAEQKQLSPAKDANLRHLFVTRPFLVLALSIVAVTLGIGGVVMNIKPLLTDNGLQSGMAAYVAATIGISLTISRLLTGYLIDRFWAPAVAFPLFVLPAVACVMLLLPSPGLAIALAAAAFVGFAAGAEGDLMAYLCSRYFGLKNYGKVYGGLFSVFILSSGLAPVLFGYSYDMFGSYDLALKTSAGLFVFAAGSILAMGPYPLGAEKQHAG